MKTRKLIELFQSLRGTGKVIRFGDLLRLGYHSAHVKLAIKETNVKLSKDSQGYTTIVL